LISCLCARNGSTRSTVIRHIITVPLRLFFCDAQDCKAANKPSKTYSGETLSIFPSKAVAKAAAVAGASRVDLTSAAKVRAAKVVSGARYARGIKKNKNVTVVKSRSARK
jgi:hypothetical protein